MANTYKVSPNEIVTLAIAAYAAIVATFVLGWDAYKWLAAGARIDLSVSPNMRIVGGGAPDVSRYISVIAQNVGDRPTTITNLGGMYFDSWWNAYVRRRKAVQAFIISQPSESQLIPYRFEVGDKWIGMAMQSDEMVNWATEGYLFLILYTAQGGYKMHRVRLKMNRTAA